MATICPRLYAVARTGPQRALIVRYMKHAPSGMLQPLQAQSGLVNGAATLSMEQVAQLSGVGTADLRALVEHGVLLPVTPGSEPSRFSLDCVMALQRAEHVRQDLALDGHGFALAMVLLSRITGLEDDRRTAHPGPGPQTIWFRPSALPVALPALRG